MAVAYDKLFRLVESQQMTSTGLMRKANISGNIISRLRHNEYVSLETIENICRVFQCRVDAVLDFKFSSEMNIAPLESLLRTRACCFDCYPDLCDGQNRKYMRAL